MWLKWTLGAVGLMLAITAVGLAHVGYSWANLWGAKLRTDTTMERNFERHRRDYEALVEMIEADDQLRVMATDRMEPDTAAAAGVTPERIDEYRRRLRRLGAKSIRRWDGSYILIVDRSGGTLVNGVMKGYLRSSSPKQPLVESTDWADKGQQDRTWYRALDDGWYIVLDR